jgi:hypothetical protein
MRRVPGSNTKCPDVLRTGLAAAGESSLCSLARRSTAAPSPTPLPPLSRPSPAPLPPPSSRQRGALAGAHGLTRGHERACELLARQTQLSVSERHLTASK